MVGRQKVPDQRCDRFKRHFILIDRLRIAILSVHRRDRGGSMNVQGRRLT